MRISKIKLFYAVTQTKVLPAKQEALVRKEEWIKEVMKTVPADWQPKTIKVTYEVFDPEIENMRKFFNGPVVEYYAIQSREDISGEISTQTKKVVRETILDETLGYDIVLLNKTTRRRKSTGDFATMQKWYDYLQTLKETIFEPQGYEFPNSEQFWEMSKKYSYEDAKRIAIEGLVARLKAKLSTVA